MRTLKTYLGKDLVKATGMATVAFTLVITVFAVIEPLREQGMSSSQAMRLFVYIMPVMFSLTLPIAALFAATIVYGRFSRDNELMACRASGINALMLLRPAIWLGMVVSVITLILGLYVAPRLMFVAEGSIKRNLRQIVYYRLKKKRYVDFSSRLFHADRVNTDEGWVEGVVGVDYSDGDDVKCLVAASAELEFVKGKDDTFVRFHPTNPAFLSQSGKDIVTADAVRLRRGDLPSMKNEPKFYDWTMLCRTWKNPQNSPIVRREIIKIKQEVCIQNFYRDVINQIEKNGKYDCLKEFTLSDTQAEPDRIVIEASQASVHENREVRLQTPPSGVSTLPSPNNSERHLVLVRQYSGDRLNRRLWARSAYVRGAWDEEHSVVLVTVVLNDVTIAGAGERIENAQHRGQYDISSLAVPDEIINESDRIDPGDLFENASDYTDSPMVHNMISAVRQSTIPRLKSKVCAEIHQRLAYGIGCLLMVMLGAALGLLFRGGEALVAFAISAGPASAVIVLMLMGKQLIANPGVPEGYGIVVVWGGIAVMAAATAYVYTVVMRR
ncbi:MAG: LptF/LptG family permease [Planctomycetota bacterium]|nr:LptF/LptG family permease [Planctomycetota bacterium]